MIKYIIKYIYNRKRISNKVYIPLYIYTFSSSASSPLSSSSLSLNNILTIHTSTFFPFPLKAKLDVNQPPFPRNRQSAALIVRAARVGGKNKYVPRQQ